MLKSFTYHPGGHNEGPSHVFVEFIQKYRANKWWENKYQDDKSTLTWKEEDKCSPNPQQGNLNGSRGCRVQLVASLLLLIDWIMSEAKVTTGDCIVTSTPNQNTIHAFRSMSVFSQL